MEFTYINGDEELVIMLSQRDLKNIGIKSNDLKTSSSLRNQILQEILETHEVGIYNDESSFEGSYDFNNSGQFFFILSKKGIDKSMRPGPDEILDMFEDSMDSGMYSGKAQEHGSLKKGGHQKVIFSFNGFDEVVKTAHALGHLIVDDSVDVTNKLVCYQDNYYLIFDFFIRVFDEESAKEKVKHIEDIVALINEFGYKSNVDFAIINKNSKVILAEDAIQNISKHFN